MSDQSTDALALQCVTLTQAAERPKLDFVLPGLLSGSVGLVVGQGAVGKSFLALHLGLAVAAGRPVANGLWEPGPKGKVTLIFGEDQPKLIQERLYWLRQAEDITDELADDIDQNLDIRSAHGIDLRLITKHRNGLVEGPFYSTLLEIAKDQRLVIIDPLIFLSDADENDNGAATQLMQALQRVARETGSTIIALHHTSKGGSGDREEWAAARGASAFTTACRWQVNLSLPSKQECEDHNITEEMRGYWVKAANVKANYGAPAEPGWLRRVKGGALRAEEISKQAAGAYKKGGDYDPKYPGHRREETSSDDGEKSLANFLGGAGL